MFVLTPTLLSSQILAGIYLILCLTLAVAAGMGMLCGLHLITELIQS